MHTTPSSPPSNLEHLHKLLSSFDRVMLITFDRVSPVPHVRARPMHVARLDVDCGLAFLTSLRSDKVAEALLEGVGHITAQRDDVSITLGGRVTVSRERARIEPLLSKATQAFFPDGIDDPDLALLEFHTDEAEIWDTSGVHGLRFVASVAHALLTGTSVSATGNHEHILVAPSSPPGHAPASP